MSLPSLPAAVLEELLSSFFSPDEVAALAAVGLPMARAAEAALPRVLARIEVLDSASGTMQLALRLPVALRQHLTTVRKVSFDGLRASELAAGGNEDEEGGEEEEDEEDEGSVSGDEDDFDGFAVNFLQSLPAAAPVEEVVLSGMYAPPGDDLFQRLVEARPGLCRFSFECRYIKEWEWEAQLAAACPGLRGVHVRGESPSVYLDNLLQLVRACPQLDTLMADGDDEPEPGVLQQIVDEMAPRARNIALPGLDELLLGDQANAEDYYANVARAMLARFPRLETLGVGAETDGVLLEVAVHELGGPNLRSVTLFGLTDTGQMRPEDLARSGVPAGADYYSGPEVWEAVHRATAEGLAARLHARWSALPGSAPVSRLEKVPNPWHRECPETEPRFRDALHVTVPVTAGALSLEVVCPLLCASDCFPIEVKILRG